MNISAKSFSFKLLSGQALLSFRLSFLYSFGKCLCLSEIYEIGVLCTFRS